MHGKKVGSPSLFGQLTNIVWTKTIGRLCLRSQEVIFVSSKWAGIGNCTRNTVNVDVFVQFGNLRQQLKLGNSLGQLDQMTVNVCFFSSFQPSHLDMGRWNQDVHQLGIIVKLGLKSCVLIGSQAISTGFPEVLRRVPCRPINWALIDGVERKM